MNRNAVNPRATPIIQQIFQNKLTEIKEPQCLICLSRPKEEKNNNKQKLETEEWNKEDANE